MVVPAARSDAAEEDTLLAAIPEPRHGKIRKLMNSALGDHPASQIEPFVRDCSAERLERVGVLCHTDPKAIEAIILRSNALHEGMRWPGVGRIAIALPELLGR